MLLRKNKLVRSLLGEALPLRILCIPGDIQKELNKILKELKKIVLLLRKRNIKQIENPLNMLEILIVCLSLMLKLKVEMKKKMLLIKKELKRSLRGLIKMQNILRRISLLGNMVMREKLGYKNQCLFLIRNSIQRKENIIKNSMSG